MRLLVLQAVFFVVTNLGSAKMPVPDDQLIISTAVAKEYGPIDPPNRNQDGTCKDIHAKEDNYPAVMGIGAHTYIKEITVLIIVDAQNDFSDDYPQSTLPVPGTAGVIDVINWIRKQGESWFGWKSLFAAVIRTEDTHPDDHISFADSKYWNTKNMMKTPEVEERPDAYNKPVVPRAQYKFTLGCMLESASGEFLDAKHPQLTGEVSSTPTYAQSTQAENLKSPNGHDITCGIDPHANIDWSQFQVGRPDHSGKSYLFPIKPNMDMWIWPKHCVIGTEGQKSNYRLITRKDDVVVPKGYYTFRESLTGQVDCDTTEEKYKLAVVGISGETRILEQPQASTRKDRPNCMFKRINLKQYLHDMEDPLVPRGPKRAKGLVIQNLIIVGFAFEYCVAQTALSLASIKTESGNPRYNVIIVTDAVGYLTPYATDIRAGIRKKLRDAGVKFVDHGHLAFV